VEGCLTNFRQMASLEFFNARFAALMKKHGINHFSVHSDKKAAHRRASHQNAQREIQQMFTPIMTLRGMNLDDLQDAWSS